VTPEDLVRAAAQALGADEAVTASALAALARRQATAGKTCARCAAPKRHAEFGVDSSTFDGLNDACKLCRAETQRQQRREGPRRHSG
jgi:hypothetical protein